MSVFQLLLPGMMTHNDKYTYGRAPQEGSTCFGFTSTHAPSAGIARTERHPPAPRGGDRSPLSRQRILRSERPGAGQVRDAAKRPAGGTFRSGGCSGLWSVPPGILCHSGVVPARGTAGAAAAQARTEAASQAQRRRDGGAGPGDTGGRKNAQGRGAGGASGPALWRRGASAEYPAAAASVSAAGGKKTSLIVEAAKPDAMQYSLQYELLRSQVISSAGSVTQGSVGGQTRGIGFALLLSEGMPGWLKTVESVLRASLAPRAVDSPDPARPETVLRSGAARI